MSTIDLFADVDGPNTGYSYQGSTDIAVVMGTDDDTDETDRIDAPSGVGNLPRHDWRIDPLLGAASVEQVDTSFYVRESGAAESQQGLADDGSSLSIIFTSTSEGSAGNYVHRDDTDISHPTNPNWAPLDFPGGGSGIIFGVRSSTDSGGTVFCTFFKCTVTFTPTVGTQAYMVSQWLLPLIGAASHGLLKSEIVQILRNLKIRPSNDEEFARIIEGFHVRPRFAI